MRGRWRESRQRRPPCSEMSRRPRPSEWSRILPEGKVWSRCGKGSINEPGCFSMSMGLFCMCRMDNRYHEGSTRMKYMINSNRLADVLPVRSSCAVEARSSHYKMGMEQAATTVKVKAQQPRISGAALGLSNASTPEDIQYSASLLCSFRAPFRLSRTDVCTMPAKVDHTHPILLELLLNRLFL